jgi:hypothetical protein
VGGAVASPPPSLPPPCDDDGGAEAATGPGADANPMTLASTMTTTVTATQA